MLSPLERKKVGFPLLTSGAAELKKYVDVYGLFVEKGYTGDLCEAYADAFVISAKKPAPFDIIQLASLYDKIADHKSAYFYLDKLSEKKLSGEEKFDFCTGMLKAVSKLGNWRDAEDFRTMNINFLQKQSSKVSQEKEAELYIALALADCAAKNFVQALKLLKFGYKPRGRKDVTLLEIFITAVYIFARAGDSEGLQGAVGNAESCLNLFKSYDFAWEEEFYKERISNASKGVL